MKRLTRSHDITHITSSVQFHRAIATLEQATGRKETVVTELSPPFPIVLVCKRDQEKCGTQRTSILIFQSSNVQAPLLQPSTKQVLATAPRRESYLACLPRPDDKTLSTRAILLETLRSQRLDGSDYWLCTYGDWKLGGQRVITDFLDILTVTNPYLSDCVAVSSSLDQSLS